MKTLMTLALAFSFSSAFAADAFGIETRGCNVFVANSMSKTIQNNVGLTLEALDYSIVLDSEFADFTVELSYSSPKAVVLFTKVSSGSTHVLTGKAFIGKNAPMRAIGRALKGIPACGLI